MTNKYNIKCIECGKFISIKDLDEKKAVSEYIGENKWRADTGWGESIYYCKNHNSNVLTKK